MYRSNEDGKKEGDKKKEEQKETENVERARAVPCMHAFARVRAADYYNKSPSLGFVHPSHRLAGFVRLTRALHLYLHSVRVRETGRGTVNGQITTTEHAFPAFRPLAPSAVAVVIYGKRSAVPETFCRSRNVRLALPAMRPSPDFPIGEKIIYTVYARCA